MPTNLIPKKYYVYVLKCADNTFYTGKTNNLPRRLLQHNGELIGGGGYTQKRRPVELIYYEEYMTNKYALHREQEIKHLNHQEKSNLIYYENRKTNQKWLTKTNHSTSNPCSPVTITSSTKTPTTK